MDRSRILTLAIISLILISMLDGAYVIQKSERIFKNLSVPSLNGNKETVSSQPIRSPSYKTASGPQSVLVFLVEFTDIKHTSSYDEIADRLHAMNDYFIEVSYEIISLNVQMNSSWISLPRNMAYYGHDVNNPGNEPDACKMIYDTLSKMDPFYDYSDYDHFMIVHAGYDQAVSNPTTLSNDIWSSFLIFDIPYESDEGASVYGGMIVSEKDPMGTFAHEFGHSLGLPDLYDVTNSDPNDFVGRWDLMSMGSYNGVPYGSSPAHLSVWCKIKLGWIQTNQILIVNKEESIIVDIAPIEIKTSGIQAIELPIATNEYYLIEFRKKVGFDSYLPNAGVLIYYCDDTVQSGYGPVRMNDANPSTSTLDDASFDVGQYLFDEKNNVKIKIISKDSNSFRIEVDRKSKDFSIGVNPQYRKISPGSTSEFIVTITYLLGSDYTVDLNVLNLPDGMEFYFDSPSVNGNASVSLTIISEKSLQAGSYTLNVTATSGWIVRFALITVEVAYEPDFILKAFPTSKEVIRGESFSYTINVTFVYGFDSEVFIEVSGIPNGIAFTLAPNSIRVGDNGYGLSTLTVETSSASPIGSHRITITGSGGNRAHSVEIYLIVLEGEPEGEAEGFVISVYPSRQVIHTGSVGRWTITVEALEELDSPVSLSVQNLPPNVTASFDREELMPSIDQPAKSTLTISIGSLAKKGVYNITVVGFKGSVSETTTFELHIPSVAIPGFQFESIFMGLILGILFLKALKLRKTKQA